MSDIVSSIVSIPTPFNMIVMIVLIACGTGVLTTIATELRKFFCHRETLEMKREMMDRGMTAAEIEQVIKAKQKGS